MELFSAFLQLLFSPCYFLGFIRCLCKSSIHSLLCHLLMALPQSSFSPSKCFSFFSLALHLSFCTHSHGRNWDPMSTSSGHLFSGVLFGPQEHWMSRDRVSHVPTRRVRRSGVWEEKAWGVAGPPIKEGKGRVRIKRWVASAESQHSAEDAASPGLRLERCAPGPTKARLGDRIDRNPPSGGGLYAVRGGCKHH